MENINNKLDESKINEVNGGVKVINMDPATAYKKYVDQKVGRYLTKEDINKKFFVIDGGSWFIGTLKNILNNSSILFFDVIAHCDGNINDQDKYKIENMNNNIFTLNANCGY